MQREQRKRKEAETRAEEERRRKERAERAVREQAINARGKTAGATSSQMIVQARKLADAKKKAIQHADLTSRRDPYGVAAADWRQEDEIRANRGSTLTREEKRLKQQAAMLGLGESATRSNKRKRVKGTHSAKAPLAKDLIAVGLVKRDKRSIDEIERDLMLARSGQSGVEKNSSKQETSTALRPFSKTTVPSTARMHHGISPADFLPGAPLRAEMAPQKKEAVNTATVLGTEKKKAKEPSKQPPPPSKRETARDRFLREEEEKKRLKAKLNGASQRFEEDSEMSDDDDDEASSEDSAEERDDGADYRDEIWRLFGRDRKQYVNRNDDSSDDDMEADMESVAREEARSARLARLEDEREELELQKLAAQKAAKKAARKMRG